MVGLRRVKFFLNLIPHHDSESSPILIQRHQGLAYLFSKQWFEKCVRESAAWSVFMSELLAVRQWPSEPRGTSPAEMGVSR